MPSARARALFELLGQHRYSTSGDARGPSGQCCSCGHTREEPETALHAWRWHVAALAVALEVGEVEGVPGVDLLARALAEYYADPEDGYEGWDSLSIDTRGVFVGNAEALRQLLRAAR